MKIIAIALILMQLMGCSVITAAAAGAVGGVTIFACKKIDKFLKEEK
ncbi:MAG: hypothetical protein LBR09_00370 [Endomicrobium sp.]|jgi:hypothetical protein|nr:hypothetical protein [Endomicrobium sp.]